MHFSFAGVTEGPGGTPLARFAFAQGDNLLETPSGLILTGPDLEALEIPYLPAAERDKGIEALQEATGAAQLQ